MKPIDLEQLKKMDPKKLREEMEAAKEEMFKASFEVKNGQSKSFHLIGNYKKYIARIQTILNSQN
ncbi:MAG: 50S ribosomal protein L29 [Candidatus Gracilibacteria bacterium]|jgi:ribosomal protein L29